MTTAIDPGDPLTDVAINTAANAGVTGAEYEVITQGSTTSTTYTATLTGSTAAGGTFVAPLNGTVRVHWFSGLYNDIATGSGYVSWELRLGAVVGSGTVIVAADDSRSLRTKSSTSPGDQQYGGSKRVSGLTPLATYNVRHMFKRETTGTFFVKNQRIAAEPVA